jgi:hypothetical protein
VDSEKQRAITEAMAEGIEAGGSSHLKSFHPRGGAASSSDWHQSPWLDFNMWQTGHGRNSPNFENITADYHLEPVKPTLDGEPGYEDHKAGFQLENGFLDDYDCRKSLYWALFSGACGHTYGCHAIWQFWQRGRPAINHPRRDWRQAMHLPGAAQMQFARQLHQSYPFLTGAPAPQMVPEQPKDKQGGENKAFHIAAICGANRAFALLYFPTNSKTEISLDGLNASKINVLWFNPRNGEIEARESIEKTATHTFTPPDWGPDWILILEATD